MNDIQLPWSFFNIHGLEFNGQISFLKAGLYYADHITAVSPTYAREITEPQFAYGMEGLLQQRHREGRLSGVLNGVDEKIWSPETDLLLASRYTRDTLEDKAENKRQLQIAMGLKVDDKVPLFAVVSRLTSQKGLDRCWKPYRAFWSRAGSWRYSARAIRCCRKVSLRRQRNTPAVGVQIGYHEAFSHRIMGGADVILVPSRFEPCGLTQLYGLKYGTLPLVRRTGGLADTVSDCSLENLADGVASGFVFEDSNAWSLLRAIRRAFVLWSRPSLWRFVQRQAMAMDFSWQVAAKSYRELYYRLK